MRDPDSILRLDAHHATRTFLVEPPPNSFLRSNQAAECVARGWLLPFEWSGPNLLRSPRVPFVTGPGNWSDSQFWDAASLTLSLESAALEAGHELKDASAWNIIFQGTRPALCDHGSFRHLRSQTWWAGGQFARHFLLPLLIARRRGLRAGQSLQLWRDGVPPNIAATLIGPARYMSRYWPLMTTPRRTSPTGPRTLTPSQPITVASVDHVRRRKRLVDGLRFMLDGLRPHSHGRVSTWVGYTQDRSHYTQAALELKLATIREWIHTVRPAWTLDLGCNTGEFSEVALESNGSVVSLDSDHASVEALYLRLRGHRRLYPVVADIDDLEMGRGWAGRELPGLAASLEDRFDLMLMLAVIHHFCVGAAVPIHEVSSWAARVCRRWLILEVVDSEDTQMRRLCADRQRDPGQFSALAQRAAFEAAGFVVRQERPLADAHRKLLLLEKTGYVHR